MVKELSRHAKGFPSPKKRTKKLFLYECIVVTCWITRLNVLLHSPLRLSVVLFSEIRLSA